MLVSAEFAEKLEKVWLCESDPLEPVIQHKFMGDAPRGKEGKVQQLPQCGHNANWHMGG